jgi:hypothetical protein
MSLLVHKIKKINFTTLIEKINTIYDTERLFKLASDKAFIQLSRQINPRNLLRVIIQTLGCQSKVNLADINQNYRTNTEITIQYKSFHNQIKKRQCSVLPKAALTRYETLGVALIKINLIENRFRLFFSEKNYMVVAYSSCMMTYCLFI